MSDHAATEQSATKKSLNIKIPAKMVQELKVMAVTQDERLSHILEKFVGAYIQRHLTWDEKANRWITNYSD